VVKSENEKEKGRERVTSSRGKVGSISSSEAIYFLKSLSKVKKKFEKRLRTYEKNRAVFSL